MRRAAAGIAPLMLLGLVCGLEVDLRANGRCQPGQVEGAPGHCIWMNQCPDGRLPGPDGKCNREIVKTEHPVEQRRCGVRFVAATQPVVKRAGCMGGKKTPPRRVFLAGGKAQVLFDKYVAHAEEQGVPLSLRRLTVVYMDAKGAQRSVEAPEMTIGHQFAGKTMKDLWRRALKDEEAQARQDAEADAMRLESDLICGS